MKTETEKIANLLELDYNIKSDFAYHNNTLVHIIPLKLPSKTYRISLFTLKEKNRCILFEDEWKNKREIALSIIANKLNTTPYRIFARKCEIKSIPIKIANAFFNQNHISGATQCSFAFGIFHENNLISCISFRRPFIKKYSSFIEIARFATKINFCVVGGLSKILKYATPTLIDKGYKGIITYADCRLGFGNGYAQTGFEFYDQTDQDYFYSNGKERFNRFKFRATKTESEKEVAIRNGVFRVYGCGSYIYIKKFEA